MEEKKDRSPAIFGIRGLAAVALLTVHVAMFSGLLGTRAFGEHRPPSNVVGAFFVSGLPSFIGVFFVLPAMYLYLPIARAVIAGEPRRPQRNPLLRRLLRLLPAYYLICAVVLLALNRDAIDGLWYVLRPFLLLHFYLPSPFVPSLMNGMEITWTVPSMVLWYLALPLIAWATHRFAARGATPAGRARRLMLPVPILIGIGVGWLFFVKAQGWDNRIVFWWPQGFAHTIGIGIALAIMLALAQVSPPDTARLLRAAAARPQLFWLGAVLVYLVNCARPFSVIGMDAIYSVSGLLVTYLMVAMFGLLAVLPLVAPGAERVRLVDAVLTNRPVVHLGRVSYGIYLWHFAVMHFFLQPGNILSGQVRPIRELYGTSGFWKLELVTLGGSVLVASLSYYLLERPVAAWGDRYLRTQRSPIRVRLRHDRERADHPTTVVVPADLSTVMTLDQASSAVAAATAERDTIRSNIVELERSFGRQILATTQLTGETKRRWDAAITDLRVLWELFTAYSAVVDEAAATLTHPRHPSASELAIVTHLLTGPSVVLTDAPAPLSQRRITDNGRTRLTASDAVQRMDRLFATTVELVTTAEAVWTQLNTRLDEIRADLARARQERPEAEVAEAEAHLHRLLHTVNTDPLSMWRDGQIDAPELDQLQRAAAAV